MVIKKGIENKYIWTGARVVIQNTYTYRRNRMLNYLCVVASISTLNILCIWLLANGIDLVVDRLANKREKQTVNDNKIEREKYYNQIEMEENK